MPIDLYHVVGSGPCRSVQLVAAALGVDLNLKLIDLMGGEQMKPEFLKMNPQHTVPTMDDNGFYLSESRAIITYLADQYGKNDALYPKDPKKRAVINQRMYFDMGTLYQAFSDYYYPMIFAGAPKDNAKFEKIGTAMGFLEKMLDGQNYVAGSNLSVADMVLITTISTYEVMEYDFSKYPNVMRWSAKVKKEIPKYEEINGAGLKAFKEFVDKLKKK